MNLFVKIAGGTVLAGALAVGGITGAFFLNPRAVTGLAFGVNTAPVDLPLKSSFEDRTPDAKTMAIVAAANAFLGALGAKQRDAATYDFSDNEQRSKWSNFPEGMIPRGGLRIGTLTDMQNELMNTLMSEIMSEAGMRNIAYQLAAEETFPTDDPFGEYGVAKYYVAFLGEPSENQPWMFQFGGHHLGINVTIYGADVTFSPMLTGGQPLYIDYEGERVFIIQEEIDAAQALLNSLNQTQRGQAVISETAINLLLGPGEYGTVVASEGVRGSDLTNAQKALLLAQIQTRLGFINEDDNAAKMDVVRAELDDTYFGWWGPQDAPGFAYYRITAPSTIIEYAPQDTLSETPEQEHAHSMFRNPSNDYGAAWIGAE
jgi:hypothetical protein